ncbi:hypothetical protein Csa_011266 [Cucumis sativus]|uniref:Uncharacterized protein n=1 Tax=Cucumis sativus TaxID=3659 RepID=A0A0A0L520_CUCSA|nr:hypothetical protein Csa_011266 [Cucumis sativus]
MASRMDAYTNASSSQCPSMSCWVFPIVDIEVDVGNTILRHIDRTSNMTFSRFFVPVSEACVRQKVLPTLSRFRVSFVSPDAILTLSPTWFSVLGETFSTRFVILTDICMHQDNHYFL